MSRVVARQLQAATSSRIVTVVAKTLLHSRSNVSFGGTVTQQMLRPTGSNGPGALSLLSTSAGVGLADSSSTKDIARKASFR